MIEGQIKGKWKGLRVQSKFPWLVNKIYAVQNRIKKKEEKGGGAGEKEGEEDEEEETSDGKSGKHQKAAIRKNWMNEKLK